MHFPITNASFLSTGSLLREACQIQVLKAPAAISWCQDRHQDSPKSFSRVTSDLVKHQCITELANRDNQRRHVTRQIVFHLHCQNAQSYRLHRWKTANETTRFMDEKQIALRTMPKTITTLSCKKITNFFCFEAFEHLHAIISLNVMLNVYIMEIIVNLECCVTNKANHKISQEISTFLKHEQFDFRICTTKISVSNLMSC